MNKLIIALLLLLVFQSCEQTKSDYLTDNRFDLNSAEFRFPQRDFKIIGFGAYHGSAKTEEVELNLLQSLTGEGGITYYLPEVDYSTAHFLDQYLQSGDTSLLRELVVHNGFHVPQERTIEAYDKWKRLKVLNDQLPATQQIKVLGIEWIRNYKFVSKHLLELLEDADETLAPLTALKDMVATDTTSYALGDLSFAYQLLASLVLDYEENTKLYLAKTKQPEVIRFMIKNIKNSFDEEAEREAILYENYLALSSIYNFKNRPQFMRVGFFHLEKSREGETGYPSFFARLLENNVYAKEDVLSIIGYFTDSKVVWDELYDEEGNYTGYTVEAGYGIGDYEKEYFRGIQHLKDTKISDQTLFRLNKGSSPYAANEPDLMEVIMQEEESNGEAVKGMSTLDFLDYAVLISDSKASTPIFELK